MLKSKEDLPDEMKQRRVSFNKEEDEKELRRTPSTIGMEDIKREREILEEWMNPTSKNRAEKDEENYELNWKNSAIEEQEELHLIVEEHQQHHEEEDDVEKPALSEDQGKLFAGNKHPQSSNDGIQSSKPARALSLVVTDAQGGTEAFEHIRIEKGKKRGSPFQLSTISISSNQSLETLRSSKPLRGFGEIQVSSDDAFIEDKSKRRARALSLQGEEGCKQMKANKKRRKTISHPGDEDPFIDDNDVVDDDVELPSLAGKEQIKIKRSRESTSFLRKSSRSDPDQISSDNAKIRNHLTIYRSAQNVPHAGNNENDEGDNEMSTNKRSFLDFQNRRLKRKGRQSSMLLIPKSSLESITKEREIKDIEDPVKEETAAKEKEEDDDEDCISDEQLNKIVSNDKPRALSLCLQSSLENIKKHFTKRRNTAPAGTKFSAKQTSQGEDTQHNDNQIFPDEDLEDGNEDKAVERAVSFSSEASMSDSFNQKHVRFSGRSLKSDDQQADEENVSTPVNRISQKMIEEAVLSALDRFSKGNDEMARISIEEAVSSAIRKHSITETKKNNEKEEEKELHEEDKTQVSRSSEPSMSDSLHRKHVSFGNGSPVRNHQQEDKELNGPTQVLRTSQKQIEEAIASAINKCLATKERNTEEDVTDQHQEFEGDHQKRNVTHLESNSRKSYDKAARRGSRPQKNSFCNNKTDGDVQKVVSIYEDKSAFAKDYHYSDDEFHSDNDEEKEKKTHLRSKHSGAADTKEERNMDEKRKEDKTKLGKKKLEKEGNEKEERARFPKRVTYEDRERDLASFTQSMASVTLVSSLDELGDEMTDDFVNTSKKHVRHSEGDEGLENLETKGSHASSSEATVSESQSLFDNTDSGIAKSGVARVSYHLPAIRKSSGNNTDSRDTANTPHPPQYSRSRRESLQPGDDDIREGEKNLRRGSLNKIIGFRDSVEKEDINGMMRKSRHYERAKSRTLSMQLPKGHRHSLTRISNAHMTAFKRLFERLDKSDSGAINAEELYQCFQEILPEVDVTSEDVEALLKGFDLKGTGEIDFDEFLYAMTHPINYVRLLDDEDKRHLAAEIRIWEEMTYHDLRRRLTYRARKGTGMGDAVRAGRSMFFRMMKAATIKYSMGGELRQYYVGEIKNQNDHVIQDWSAGQRCTGLTAKEIKKRYDDTVRKQIRKKRAGCTDYSISPYAQPLFWDMDKEEKDDRIKAASNRKFLKRASEAGTYRRNKYEAEMKSTRDYDGPKPSIEQEVQYKTENRLGEIRRLQVIRAKNEEIRKKSSVPSGKLNKPIINQRGPFPKKPVKRPKISEFVCTPKMVPLPRIFLRGCKKLTCEDIEFIRDLTSETMESYYSKLKEVALENAIKIFKQLHVEQMSPTLRKVFTDSYWSYAGDLNLFVVAPWIPVKKPKRLDPYPELGVSAKKQECH